MENMTDTIDLLDLKISLYTLIGLNSSYRQIMTWLFSSQSVTVSAYWDDGFIFLIAGRNKSGGSPLPMEKAGICDFLKRKFACVQK